MKTLLDDLSPQDLDSLLRLVHGFKNRFSAAVKEYIDAAHARGIKEPVICAAIADECLKLSAAMYTGDHETFIECARGALEFAERMRPKTAVQ